MSYEWPQDLFGYPVRLTGGLWPGFDEVGTPIKFGKFSDYVDLALYFPDGSRALWAPKTPEENEAIRSILDMIESDDRRQSAYRLMRDMV